MSRKIEEFGQLANYMERREGGRKDFFVTLLSSASLIICAIALIIIFFCGGLFVSENKALTALQTNGFTEVKIIDHDWFLIFLRGGDARDNARFKATALNPRNERVTVYVFAGWPFKGATIRTP